MPCGGIGQAKEHQCGRCFACSVGTEKTEDLTPVNLEVQMIHRFDIAIIFTEIGDLDDGILFFGGCHESVPPEFPEYLIQAGENRDDDDDADNAPYGLRLNGDAEVRGI